MLVNLFQIHVKIPIDDQLTLGSLSSLSLSDHIGIFYMLINCKYFKLIFSNSDILLFLTALLETPTKDKLGAHLVLILHVHQEYVLCRR